MSDFGEMQSAIKDHKKRLRAMFGIECPECKRLRPRANATIMLPQQRRRVDGYRDLRPELNDVQWSSV